MSGIWKQRARVVELAGRSQRGEKGWCHGSSKVGRLAETSDRMWEVRGCGKAGSALTLGANQGSRSVGRELKPS